MSPEEYIMQRKLEFARPSVEERYFSDYLSQELKSDPSLENRMRSLGSTDYALHLCSLLRPRLPPQVVQLIDSTAVDIGEVHDPQPNAHCQLLESGCFAITFNTGLKDFNYRVIRALSTRFFPIDGERNEAVSFNETCIIIGDIFLWLNELGASHGPAYPISDDQFRIANILTFEVNCFFLAHELAHGVFYHDSNKERVEASDATIDPKQEEHFADDFAFHVLMHRPEGSTGLPPVEISYAAIELALLIWKGLELFGVEFEETHPRADQRLNSIRRALEGACKTEDEAKVASSLASPIREVFERVIGQIMAGNYEDFLDRVAKDWLEELEELLDRCTGGSTPDYMTFYSEANCFFNKGISLKLSQRMAEVTRRFFEIMEGSEEAYIHGGSQEAWVQFQKYKLFLGFVEQMHPSVKPIFEGALGVKGG